MAIFPRRVVQRCIYELHRTLSISQLAPLIRTLNTGGQDLLTAEWEVVLLAALAREARLAYEQPNASGRRPDLHVSPHHDPSLVFVADITTVSDKGYEEQNPLRELHERIRQLAHKKHLTLAGFDVKVGGSRKGEFGHQRVLLALPRHSSEIDAFDRQFSAFLASVAAARAQPADFSYRENGADIHITYKPGARYFTGSHLSYTATYGIDNNPLYRTLKRKRDQLASSEGVTGLIICDGNCELLRPRMMGSTTFTLEQVVARFFEREDEFDFVLCIGVSEPKRRPISGTDGPPSLNITPFVRRQGKPHASDIARWLKRSLQALPSPSVMPYNALERLRSRHPHKGDSHLGGLHMTKDEIRISARAVLDLLAGKTSFKSFAELHGFSDSKSFTGNPFKTMQQNGRLIDNVSIAKEREDDDDWLVFKFGPPDPAVSPYQSPAKE